MKNITVGFLLSILLLFAGTHQANAQNTKELLAGNVLNGAVTGSLAGLATMGLTNNSDFAPLRIGLGAGILAGTGIAAIDIASAPADDDFYINGTFNSGSNSSVIILLDTVYGAGGGAVIGTAIRLIQDKPIVQGLQYGSSVGAWTGLGFGLIDAFFLADREPGQMANKMLNRSSVIEVAHGNYEVGFLQPQLTSYTDFSSRGLTQEFEPTVGVINFRTSF